MPEADLILSVGDMMDRGPKSKEVIEFFMNTPNTEALYGNHEDLMYEACSGIEGETDVGAVELWFRNGGYETVKSYGGDRSMIPKKHLAWIRSRPLYFETNELFVSHAPVTNFNQVPGNRFTKKFDIIEDFIWNRLPPHKPLPKFCVYGHNGKVLKCKWGNGDVVAACVDGQHSATVAGMHWPSKEIFIQDFL